MSNNKDRGRVMQGIMDFLLKVSRFERLGAHDLTQEATIEYLLLCT